MKRIESKSNIPFLRSGSHFFVFLAFSSVLGGCEEKTQDGPPQGAIPQPSPSPSPSSSTNNPLGTSTNGLNGLGTQSIGSWNNPAPTLSAAPIGNYPSLGSGNKFPMMMPMYNSQFGGQYGFPNEPRYDPAVEYNASRRQGFSFRWPWSKEANASNTAATEPNANVKPLDLNYSDLGSYGRWVDDLGGNCKAYLYVKHAIASNTGVYGIYTYCAQEKRIQLEMGESKRTELGTGLYGYEFIPDSRAQINSCISKSTSAPVPNGLLSIGKMSLDSVNSTYSVELASFHNTAAGYVKKDFAPIPRGSASPVFAGAIPGCFTVIPSGFIPQ